MYFMNTCILKNFSIETCERCKPFKSHGLISQCQFRKIIRGMGIDFFLMTINFSRNCLYFKSEPVFKFKAPCFPLTDFTECPWTNHFSNAKRGFKFENFHINVGIWERGIYMGPGIDFFESNPLPSSLINSRSMTNCNLQCINILTCPIFAR
jgi:hypothetical protein